MFSKRVRLGILQLWSLVADAERAHRTRRGKPLGCLRNPRCCWCRVMRGHSGRWAIELCRLHASPERTEDQPKTEDQPNRIASDINGPWLRKASKRSCSQCFVTCVDACVCVDVPLLMSVRVWLCMCLYFKAYEYVFMRCARFARDWSCASVSTATSYGWRA